MDKSILFIDNNPSFRKALASLLSRAGFSVTEAGSVSEAEALLQARFFILIICDLRLENDDDTTDRSGLRIIQDQRFRSHKVLLTAYGDYESAGTAGPHVIGMFDKEDPKKVIRGVQGLFEDKIHVNWSLKFHRELNQPTSFQRLAELMEPHLEPEFLLHRADELAFLFAGLFSRETAVRLGRVLWHEGDKVALIVHLFHGNYAPKGRILILGQREEMEAEHNNRRAIDDIHGSTNLGDEYFLTQRFGGQTYITTGGDLERVIDFEKIYRYSNWERVKPVMEHMFSSTLQAWHGALRLNESRPMMDWYKPRLSQSLGDEMANAMEHLVALCQKVSTTRHKLVLDEDHLTLLHGSEKMVLTNPLRVFREDPQVEVPYLNFPGCLYGWNILIEGEHSWLTDFRDPGLAPAPRNFVSFEAMIRFDWTQFEDIDEVVRFVTLFSREPFQSESIPEKSEWSKPFSAVNLSRRFYLNHHDDHRAYALGLFFHLIGRLLATSPDQMLLLDEERRLFHCLLACGQITQYLYRKNEKKPSQTITGAHEQSYILAVDPGRRVVTLADREVTLAAKRFKIFWHLYQKAGQFCSRQELGDLIYKQYDATDKTDQINLNSMVARIREQLEPDPSKPRLIITVPDGYRLEP